MPTKTKKKATKKPAKKKVARKNPMADSLDRIATNLRPFRHMFKVADVFSNEAAFLRHEKPKRRVTSAAYAG